MLQVSVSVGAEAGGALVDPAVPGVVAVRVGDAHAVADFVVTNALAAEHRLDDGVAGRAFG